MRFLLFALLLVLAGVARAESPPQLSLVTFSPGDIYWQRFGHNALVLREGGRMPELYNYGVFDFRQKNFFLNFARGRMLYRLDVDLLWPVLQSYARDGRWAYEQVLNLSPAQARKLATFLRWNARPENAEYRYEYFTENCSTRVRDALDHALDGALRRALEAQPAGRSLRFEATRLIAPHAPLALGMDAGMGPRADTELNVWQQSFVPMTLMRALNEVELRDEDGGVRPLVAQQGWLVEAVRSEPAEPRQLFLPFALTGLAFATLLLRLPRSQRPALRRTGAMLAVALTLIAGLGGWILLLGWTATEHWVMQRNGNLLLFNPLALLLLPACWRLRESLAVPRRVRILAALIALGSCAAPVLALLSGQQQAPWIALWLPIHLALAWRLLREA